MNEWMYKSSVFYRTSSPSGPLPCFLSFWFTMKRSRATGIADHILPLGNLLALTYSFLQYLCIQAIFWTNLIYFEQLSNSSRYLCKGAQGVHRLLRLQIRPHKPQIRLLRPHVRLLRSLRTNSTLPDLKLALLRLESDLGGISPLRPRISPFRSLTSPCRLLITPLGLQGHKL